MPEEDEVANIPSKQVEEESKKEDGPKKKTWRNGYKTKKNRKDKKVPMIWVKKEIQSSAAAVVETSSVNV